MKNCKKVTNKILSMVLSILLISSALSATLGVSAETSGDISVWDGSGATAFAGGTGTKSDPYLISNGAELKYLADQVNANNGKNESTNFAGVYFKLTADIYLNDFKSSIPQSFAVYFDSKAHDYEEAAMYTKEYFEEVAEAVKEQEDATSISNVDKGADAVRISSVADAGVLTVNVPEGLDGALLQIYSLSGAVVASSSLSGAGAHSVNVASLSPGLYVATVAVGGTRTEQKIMVR